MTISVTFARRVFRHTALLGLGLILCVTTGLVASDASLPPTITSLSPTSGPDYGGDATWITGTNLTGATAVTFDGTAVVYYSVNSATQMIVVAPAHAAGLVDVVVTTPGGSATLTNGYRYTPKPTITAISPAAGRTAGGTAITLTGTGFIGEFNVSFDGTDATNVVVVSATTITATTPAHAAGVVDVEVCRCSADEQTGTLSSGFTYAPAPTVTAISPTSGTTSGGTSVTLTGTTLTGTTGVTFGGTAATNVAVVSATSVTATTPAHAAGAVDVVATTPGGTGTLTSGFTYGAVVNGACGSANNTASAFVPSANLCSAGTAGSVANASPWTWTCTGSGPSHTDASCSAPNAPTEDASLGRAVIAATNNWVVDAANSLGFVADHTLPAMPAGATCIHGVLGMRLITGTAGSAATVTITYPNALPAGTVYWKYGKTAATPTSHWYPFAGAVISGNTITLTITDGGNGDDDLTANSVIVDPGGPGAAAGVPTLPEWALLFLALALGGGGYIGLRQRRLAGVRTTS